MSTHYFWDIENVSFHNLKILMDRVNGEKDNVVCHVVFAKIKDTRREALTARGWKLVETEGIARNSADKKIKDMIRNLLDDPGSDAEKVVIISEDKGFRKTGMSIIEKGLDLEIICATKDPGWVRELMKYKETFKGKRG